MRASLNVIDEKHVLGLYELVKEFHLEDAFREEFGCSIEDYDYAYSDESIECMRVLMEKYLDGLWMFEDHGDEWFTLYKLNESKPLLIKGKIAKQKVVFT